MKNQELDNKKIKEYLRTDFIGRNIEYYESINSTNKRAKKIANKVKEGTVLIAEEQLDGRGRMDRKWISAKGKDICMSVILKPDTDPMGASKVTSLGAASVHQALESMNIESKIKWPNDILIENKKICGILTEMKSDLDIVDYVIIGIGINVNLGKKEIPKELKNKATSIKITQGIEIERNILIANILNEFEELYKLFKNKKDMSKVMDICRRNSALIGKDIQVIKGKKVKNGKAININEDGELVVEFESGIRKNIFSGEVSIRKKDE